MPGTGGAKSQVRDEGVNNRVVGHLVGELARQDGLRPGIGQRLQAIKDELDALDLQAEAMLNPGEAPEATFAIKAEKVVAREYCNLHGLWKA